MARKVLSHATDNGVCMEIRHLLQTFKPGSQLKNFFSTGIICEAFILFLISERL